ncbi:MAG TPA: SAM-dependent methyltransferase [Syntrophaceae bacterium]|nr:SAM-dependent methyltransferase [Syntrophaceae bacterium]
MKIDVPAVRKCLKQFDFKTLFREHLGWDNHHAQLDIPVNGQTVSLCAIAQKRGFVAFICDSHIPDRATRLKIDHQITKSAREHFVIYADKAAGQQVWQWVRREPGKPLASRDHRFDIRQSGDFLTQRLNQIAVDMEEEENITVVDVAGRARAAFDVDKVTKRFYDRFKTEHAAFLKLINGFPRPRKVNGKEEQHPDLQWYTSLMLNRLMFVYFIQKKGFLDGDTEYLRNRLKLVQQARGKDKFLSFYRYFLMRLFHDGLGKSPNERKLDPAIEKLLGRVPFLNGGFFEVHELEQRYSEIDIPDNAFEKLFDFFDQYRWHLDERPLRADNEINPDVVGYIFEKYINQKQMGAYYTKEDITEYNGKNTIIPFIFDAAQKKCAIAFQPDSALWRLLRDNPDRYIYPAVRHGVVSDDGSIVPESELPDFVQKGMHDPQTRMHDNRYNLQQAQAHDPIRLVTETWREYVGRRNRCLEMRAKLQRGEVHQINDLITLNLDIWQFARDAIVNAEGPELLRAFWQAITAVTVLDPTCGSGAFLFAALRILETLYSDCLERMDRFIEDLADKPHHPEQYSDFKKVLAQIAKHPNERYFVLKSIIINNLFGVDIMKEAVEICKLRLFLKLVAQVEKVEQIEPLPDMDFNIRSGNTLVGYATADQVRKAFTEERHSDLQVQGRLLMGEDEDNYKRFEESAGLVDKAFRQFRAQQTTHGGKVTHKDKLDLRQRLAELDAQLDLILAGEYGITPKSYGSKAAYEQAFIKWKDSHQPFHWFVEFYGIMSAGGFDVIIGNPPYVEYAKVKNDYTIHGYTTESCGNLYAFLTERSFCLLQKEGSFGFIVPISLVCTQRMEVLQNSIASFSKNIWLSNYAERPSKLFVGAEVLLTIVLTRTGISSANYYTTKFMKWASEERSNLFQRIEYQNIQNKIKPYVINKQSEAIELQIIAKLLNQAKQLGYYFQSNSKYPVYYRIGGGRYWKIFTNFQPQFVLNDKNSVSSRENYLYLEKAELRDVVITLLSSSLFYWYFIMTTNCRDLNPSDLNNYPFQMETMSEKHTSLLAQLCKALMIDYKNNSLLKEKTSSLTGAIKYQEFYPRLSKDILDNIDKVLAQHYGFTDEELDFIINYDIKYRMGNADDETGDDE